MPEVPPESKPEREDVPPSEQRNARPDQLAPEGPPHGPFDKLFEQLDQTEHAPGQGWHASHGIPSTQSGEPLWSERAERPLPRPETREGAPIQRPDDSPFATINLPQPYAATPYEALPHAPPARRSILRPLGRLARELAETVVLALAIFLLVRAVMQNFQVEGRSMEPTLETGWYLLVNKALYWEVNLETIDKFVPFIDPGDDPTRYLFRGPERGDVIVFRQPNQPPGAAERDFIKRIIGLPGDVVEVRDGTVFIDGEPLDEPYIADKPGYTCPPKVVPEGHYWVLGDNRNNSQDSHSWGPIPKENIIGQAWVTYWPFDDFGLIDNTHAHPNGSSTNPPSKEELPLFEIDRPCQ
jgi:signal peptidase I